MATDNVGRKVWIVTFPTSNVQTTALTQEVEALNRQCAQGSVTERDNIVRDQLPGLRTRVEALGGTFSVSNQYHPDVNQGVHTVDRGGDMERERKRDTPTK
jgi:RPA family protein